MHVSVYGVADFSYCCCLERHVYDSGRIEISSKDSLHNAVIKAGALNADFLVLRRITDVIANDGGTDNDLSIIQPLFDSLSCSGEVYSRG